MVFMLKHQGGDMNKGSGMEILQGDLNLLEGIESFEKLIDLILVGAGSSPIYDEGTAMKTTSEIFANQEISNETLRMIKNLRVDQLTRIFSKALIIGINQGSPLLEGVS